MSQFSSSGPGQIISQRAAANQMINGGVGSGTRNMMGQSNKTNGDSFKQQMNI